MGKNKILKNGVTEYIIIALIFASIVIMAVSFQNREFSYFSYNTSNLQYVKAEVIEVIEENITDERGYTTGYQKLKIEILEGESEGVITEVDNYITSTHNVVLETGSNVIICADMPEGLEPYYSIYNYDRTLPMFFVIAFFVVLVAVIGRKKGLMSCIGLLFTVCTVICILIPELFEGSNAVLISVLTVAASSAVSCFCISGLTIRTAKNMLSTVLGVISAGLIFLLFKYMMNISGTNLSESELLAQIAHRTGLQLSGILFAGVLVSSLGAVMDVAVSMGASLHEIREIDPRITPKELFRSGMNIGRDMIGTMTNTLILAFVGGTLASLIVFTSYGIRFHQLVSSDFLALELATGIAGSAAVVLTVPISAFVNAYGRKRR